MCKHVLNAQVAIRFPCCLRFYDCVDCHEEGKEGGRKTGHAMKRSEEMVFQCKSCDACFRKNMLFFEEADEFCPHCGNRYVITAKTPETEKEAQAAAGKATGSAARPKPATGGALVVHSGAGTGAGAGSSARG